ncbi:MAG: hypothetical protein IKX26_00125 [Bacteroidales bacterium]|nr:hypothetical protein [Bacteroidales bacterium]
MNLFIFPYQSDNFYTCPDTAIVREKDTSGCFKYWVPDGIETLRAIRFAYVRIERAGKCIREEFAHRHYKTCGWGVHLSTYDVNEGNTLDNSIFLSEATSIGDEGPYEGFEAFDTVLQRASEYMTLRSGDLVLLELEDIGAYEIEPDRTQTLSCDQIKIDIIS